MGEELLYNKDFGLPKTDTPLLYQELQKQVDQVMNSLSPRCREVFSLSRFEHLKNREIAHKLGISISAVEKHIRTALQSFSAALKESGDVYFILMVAMFFLGKE
jgi:RNA polymerase sigma-70 factor (ECF subfamily)